jgi:hypothetical protein
LGLAIAEIHYGCIGWREVRSPDSEAGGIDAAADPELTKRGELVYEPFLGSGTTLGAAEVTQRVCYGLELDPKYVDVVVLRWQALTGKDATLDGDGRTFAEIKAACEVNTSRA